MDDLSLRFLAMLGIGITSFLVGGLALKIVRVIFEKVFAEQIKRLENQEREVKRAPTSAFQAEPQRSAPVDSDAP